MKISKKSVTFKELKKINDKSIKLDFNRTLDLEKMLKNGKIIDDKKFYYPVGKVMWHPNMNGTECIRVEILLENENSCITDFSVEDYENLYIDDFEIWENGKSHGYYYKLI